ncbi:MAG: hypothetical protein FH758_10795 [Firmicutes bacterium]|nr:hypothetical protein [Bacillota bacterium]
MLHEQLDFLEENNFFHDKVLAWNQIPPQDEPFVSAWGEYIQDIPHKGALAALSQRLVQLRFPVQEGMSANPDYLMATRKGMPTATMKVATGTELKEPKSLKVYLYQTYAGKIPVLETSNRNDFETLVRVLSHRNEPVKIPVSMGACLIKGYNNWDRVAKYKQSTEDFDFNYMKAHKELYQDAFLILTDNVYSGVPAEMMGLSEDYWRQLSMTIRREHEATHYFTLRFLGSARNHLLDEFIADYMGIVAANGKYRAEWFLCFLGLENYPNFRPGGRLTNYLKNVRLTKEAFDQLIIYLKKAAENVEKFSNKHYKQVYSDKCKYEMLLKLSKTNLIALASENAEKVLLDS